MTLEDWALIALGIWLGQIIWALLERQLDKWH
jgi:hypothetical protein